MRLALPSCVLFLTSAVPSAAQALFVVAANGSGTHTTIQAAVNAAASGDFVEVRSGAYMEDVTIDGKGLTLVSASQAKPTIRGVLTLRNLPANEAILCSNLAVAPPGQAQIGVLQPAALVVQSCAGAVRVQGLAATGAAGGWTTPPPFFTPGLPGGGGAIVDDSADVALVDSTVFGGSGAPWAGVPWDGGSGGLALDVRGASNVVVQRCLVRGGEAQDGESGGSGGSGARIEGPARMIIGYSAFVGRHGASAINLEGGSGGDGLIVESGATVHDFGGVFQAGVQGTTWMQLGAPPRDGFPITGSGTVDPVPPAHPSAVHAPSVVRAGQAWSFEVAAEAGDLALPLAGEAPSFRWIPTMRQPLLFVVDRVATFALGGWHAVPATGRLDLPQPPATLAPNQAPRVVWLTARIAPPMARLTSTRAVVVLP
jgi:hypothetical protein